MIHYALVCAEAHEFDGWFRDSATFDAQAKSGRLTCPVCGSPKVSKGVMAPHVTRSGRDRVSESVVENAPGVEDDAHREMRAKIHELREKIVAATEDVGERFPSEARKIEEGAADARPIRGRASLAEVKSLLEDGIAVLPLPGEGN